MSDSKGTETTVPTKKLTNKEFVQKVLGVPYIAAIEAVAEVIDSEGVVTAAVAGRPEQKATGLQAAFRTISNKTHDSLGNIMTPERKAHELRGVYEDRFGKYLKPNELDKLMRQSNWSTIVGHIIQADSAKGKRKNNDVVIGASSLLNAASSAFNPPRKVETVNTAPAIEENC